MAMNIQQVFKIIKQWMPTMPDNDIMVGIKRFAQKYPNTTPEDALKALYVFLSKDLKNNKPKSNVQQFMSQQPRQVINRG
jgi:hypothetical protein